MGSRQEGLLLAIRRSEDGEGQGGAGANAKGVEPLARSDFAAVVHGGPSDLACSRARVPSREKRDFAAGRIDPRSCPHHREVNEIVRACEYVLHAILMNRAA